MNTKTKKSLSYICIITMLCSLSTGTSSNFQIVHKDFKNISAAEKHLEKNPILSSTTYTGKAIKIVGSKSIYAPQKKVSNDVKTSKQSSPQVTKKKVLPVEDTVVQTPVTKTPLVKNTPKIISDEANLVLNAAAEKVISDEATAFIQEEVITVTKVTETVHPQKKPTLGFDIPETAKTLQLSSISQKAEYLSKTMSNTDLEKLFHKNQARFKNISSKVYNYEQFTNAWEAYSKLLPEEGEEKTLVLKQHFIETYFYLRGVEDENYKQSLKKQKETPNIQQKKTPQKRK